MNFTILTVRLDTEGMNANPARVNGKIIGITQTTQEKGINAISITNTTRKEPQLKTIESVISNIKKLIGTN